MSTGRKHNPMMAGCRRAQSQTQVGAPPINAMHEPPLSHRFMRCCVPALTFPNAFLGGRTLSQSVHHHWSFSTVTAPRQSSLARAAFAIGRRCARRFFTSTGEQLDSRRESDAPLRVLHPNHTLCTGCCGYDLPDCCKTPLCLRCSYRIYHVQNSTEGTVDEHGFEN